MCGISGYYSLRKHRDLQSVIQQMTDALAHRGPDGSGTWADPADGIALGHRRLAIVDLSPAGSQPMHSPSRRYVGILNGEIYNHSEIRAQLQIDDNIAWRGHSDTEVFLAAIDQWGLSKTLEMSVGMFAIALWDREEKKLYLIRDRLGEKPLYYGLLDNAFMFASELKALRSLRDWTPSLHRKSLNDFMQFGYVPTPHSIYEGVYKLPPGTVLLISNDGDCLVTGTPSPYWAAKDICMQGQQFPFSGSPDEAVSELKSVLVSSVKQQMLADVPLGAFLSGGIDSTTIVALMQKESPRPVRTFTIGFHEQSHNEAFYARQIAKHLGTDHNELYASPQDALNMIPRLPSIYDEPFADSSQIPTCLVSSLTRKHVTVSLSGDGGDELFGGYNRHVWAKRIWHLFGNYPMLMRRFLAAGMRATPPGIVDSVASALQFILPMRYRVEQPGDKLHKLSGVIDSPDEFALYLRLLKQWRDPQSILIQQEIPTAEKSERSSNGLVPFMMQHDLTHYLPDDILVKVDRASMAVALESRAPFLDHRVVECAWRLPIDVRIQNGVSKWPLRQILSHYVPLELIDRPKMGFGVPLGVWLRGPLREWAESLLDEKRIRQEGIFRPEPIRAAWLHHLSGKQNLQHKLWCILMFQAWKEKWLP